MTFEEKSLAYEVILTTEFTFFANWIASISTRDSQVQRLWEESGSSGFPLNYEQFASRKQHLQTSVFSARENSKERGKPTTALLAEWPSASLTLRRFLNFYISVLSFCSRFGEQKESFTGTLSVKSWGKKACVPCSSRRCLSSLEELIIERTWHGRNRSTSSPYNATCFFLFLQAESLTKKLQRETLNTTHKSKRTPSFYSITGDLRKKKKKQRLEISSPRFARNSEEREETSFPSPIFVLDATAIKNVSSLGGASSSRRFRDRGKLPVHAHAGWFSSRGPRHPPSERDSSRKSSLSLFDSGGETRENASTARQLAFHFASSFEPTPSPPLSFHPYLS